MKDVFGGSDQSSSSSSKSGFQTLPPEIQDAFKKFATEGQGLFQNGGAQNMFTPLAQTAGETQAINAVNNGFTPTASSLQSDIAMQQNPFDQSVIDEINRQSTGQNSALQRNMANAGQFGSNRQMLGANDIDLSRLNQIGSFKQNQFNTSLNNAMTVLPQSRANDAQAQFGVGSFQRGLNAQQQQVPYTSLQAWGQLLGILPKDGGTNSNSSSSGSSSGGIIPGIGSLW